MSCARPLELFAAYECKGRREGALCLAFQGDGRTCCGGFRKPDAAAMFCELQAASRFPPSWNCSSSVEPLSAVVELCPPWMVWVTASK